jgi:gas vesicle protein
MQDSIILDLQGYISMSMSSGTDFALGLIATSARATDTRTKGDNMKAVKWFVVIVAITLTAACGQQDTETSSREELKSAASDIQQASKNLINSIQDYSMEQKEALQKRVQDQINNLSDKINDLQAKSENATHEAKAALQEATADLNQKLETVRGQIPQLENATADTWENVKGGLSAAMRDVEDAYNEAASRL